MNAGTRHAGRSRPATAVSSGVPDSDLQAGLSSKAWQQGWGWREICVRDPKREFADELSVGICTLISHQGDWSEPESSAYEPKGGSSVEEIAYKMGAPSGYLWHVEFAYKAPLRLRTRTGRQVGLSAVSVAGRFTMVAPPIR